MQFKETMAQFEKGIQSGKIENAEEFGADSEARYATLYKLALDSAERSDEERLTREREAKDSDDGEPSLIGVYVFIAVAILVLIIVLVVVLCLYQKRKNEK